VEDVFAPAEEHKTATTVRRRQSGWPCFFDNDAESLSITAFPGPRGADVGCNQGTADGQAVTIFFHPLR
jgi:hypothetical protein